MLLFDNDIAGLNEACAKATLHESKVKEAVRAILDTQGDSSALSIEEAQLIWCLRMKTHIHKYLPSSQLEAGLRTIDRIQSKDKSLRSLDFLIQACLSIFEMLSKEKRRSKSSATHPGPDAVSC